MRVVSVELVLKQKTSQDQVDQNQNRMLVCKELDEKRRKKLPVQSLKEDLRNIIGH